MRSPCIFGGGKVGVPREDCLWGVQEMKAYFERMARYSRWANQRLYGAVAQLEPEEIAAPRSGFFPSILKTLNHMVVTDRVWMGRFTAEPSVHKRLDEVPYNDFGALTLARAAEDQRILDFFKELPQSRID